MSYPRYEAYKDSGIEWLGEIPAHWQLRKLKFFADYVTRGDSPSYTDESSIKVVNQACVQNNGLALERVRYNQDVDISKFKGKLQYQDILLNSTGTGTLGRVALFDIDTSDRYMADGHVTIIRDTNNRFVPKYLYYYLKTRQEWITAFASDGATNQIELNREKLRNVLFPFPLLPEQQAIAAFLDRETARIDTLIAKQEQMIALSQEKRKALISHAVTRGLDPNVPLKDSGVDWLGMVPEHWEVKRLKHISPQQLVGVVVNPSSYVTDDGVVPFLLGSDVSENQIHLGNVRKISHESNATLAKSILRSGDLVTVRVGDPGITAVIPSHLDGCNCASMMVVRQSQEFVSRWLCYAMNSKIGKAQVEMVQYGAAQKQFNISHAVEFAYPVPPKTEQIEISDYLDSETTKIDTLITKAKAAIDLLKEHRTSLISAAVTGKIDVRGL